jgi:hypothetical protein
MTSAIQNNRYIFGLHRLYSTRKNYFSQVEPFAYASEISGESISSMNCEVYTELKCLFVGREYLAGYQQFMLIQREKHNLKQVTENLSSVGTSSDSLRVSYRFHNPSIQGRDW